MTGNLAFLDLAEAAELIRTRKLSPVEYTTALLAQIERHDPKLNAFIAVLPERALAAARAVSRHSLCAQGHHRRRRDRHDGAFAGPVG